MFFWKKFLTNGSVSTNPTMQEGNKSSKCQFFLLYSKSTLHQNPGHYDQPKLPCHDFFSTTIRTYSNPLSFQWHQLTLMTKQHSWWFCNTFSFCYPKSNVSILINILTKLSKIITINSWNLSNLRIIW